MLEIPRRSQHLSVALPSSFTRDVPHLRERTSRAGLIARALGIFRVEEVFIYDDQYDKSSKQDGPLLEKLLRYQETPQYLRKTLFARDPDFQFAGILPPLRLPNHPNREEPRIGSIRDGMVVEEGQISKVDIGFKASVKVASKLRRLDRVTMRVIQTTPSLEGELIASGRLPIYWGFRVTRTDSTLGELLRKEKSDLTISTSRKGQALREKLPEFSAKWKSSKRTIVLFGSPDQGVPEILERERVKIGDVVDFNLNMIPAQGVETVRTEEALFATLSILNLLGDQ